MKSVVLALLVAAVRSLYTSSMVPPPADAPSVEGSY